MPVRSRLPIAAAVALGAACGGSPVTPPPPPPPTCAGVTPVSLGVGAHQVLDPAASNGCVIFPAQAGPEAEYVMVMVSTSGVITGPGVSGTYNLQGAAVAATSPQFSAVVGLPIPTLPHAFHANLRAREAELAAGGGIAPAPPVLDPAPPALGSQRTFKVCSNLQCNSFSDVPATAKYVGSKVAVYLDNDVPQETPYTQADLDDLGRTFDLYHHPINVTAFGNESDIDANGVVAVLLTDGVNALTPDCSNGRVLGYFFGGDLIPGSAGSNAGEVFYALVPAPATGNCPAVSRSAAVAAVKGTLIHEFQHMISFNQHVLVRQGQSERVWLNEALSHFAEELGGRLIPDSECQPAFTSCRSLYTSGNLINAYDYLENPESFYLISPGSSSGTLEERGAGWLFLRWVADHHSSDQPLGTSATRALVGTTLTGFANVEAVTGRPLATLITEWHLANYLDDLPGFTPGSARISFTSWGFRDIWARNAPPQGTVFPRPFPMEPGLLTAPTPFSRSGTLRGGSGPTFRVVMPPGSANYPVLVRKTAGGVALDAALATRIGIARIR